MAAPSHQPVTRSGPSDPQPTNSAERNAELNNTLPIQSSMSTGGDGGQLHEPVLLSGMSAQNGAGPQGTRPERSTQQQ